MNQAERIIEKFPKGQSWLAEELETSPSTVGSWRARGCIPRWWHDSLLKIAKKNKIPLTKQELAE